MLRHHRSQSSRPKSQPPIQLTNYSKLSFEASEREHDEARWNKLIENFGKSRTSTKQTIEAIDEQEDKPEQVARDSGESSDEVDISPASSSASSLASSTLSLTTNSSASTILAANSAAARRSRQPVVAEHGPTLQAARSDDDEHSSSSASSFSSPSSGVSSGSTSSGDKFDRNYYHDQSSPGQLVQVHSPGPLPSEIEVGECLSELINSVVLAADEQQEQQQVVQTDKSIQCDEQDYDEHFSLTKSAHMVREISIEPVDLADLALVLELACRCISSALQRANRSGQREVNWQIAIKNSNQSTGRPGGRFIEWRQQEEQEKDDELRGQTSRRVQFGQILECLVERELLVWIVDNKNKLAQTETSNLNSQLGGTQTVDGNNNDTLNYYYKVDRCEEPNESSGGNLIGLTNGNETTNTAQSASALTGVVWLCSSPEQANELRKCWLHFEQLKVVQSTRDTDDKQQHRDEDDDKPAGKEKHADCWQRTTTGNLNTSAAHIHVSDLSDSHQVVSAAAAAAAAAAKAENINGNEQSGGWATKTTMTTECCEKQLRLYVANTTGVSSESKSDESICDPNDDYYPGEQTAGDCGDESNKARLSRPQQVGDGGGEPRKSAQEQLDRQSFDSAKRHSTSSGLRQTNDDGRASLCYNETTKNGESKQVSLRKATSGLQLAGQVDARPPAGLASYYRNVASKMLSSSRIKSFRDEINVKLNNNRHSMGRHSTILMPTSGRHSSSTCLAHSADTARPGKLTSGHQRAAECESGEARGSAPEVKPRTSILKRQQQQQQCDRKQQVEPQTRSILKASESMSNITNMLSTKQRPTGRFDPSGRQIRQPRAIESAQVAAPADTPKSRAEIEVKVDYEQLLQVKRSDHRAGSGGGGGANSKTDTNISSSAPSASSASSNMQTATSAGKLVSRTNERQQQQQRQSHLRSLEEAIGSVQSSRRASNASCLEATPTTPMAVGRQQTSQPDNRRQSASGSSRAKSDVEQVRPTSKQLSKDQEREFCSSDDDDDDDERAGIDCDENQKPQQVHSQAQLQATREQAFERLRQRASCYDISRLMSKNNLQNQLSKLRSVAGSTDSINGGPGKQDTCKARQRRPPLLLDQQTRPIKGPSDEKRPIIASDGDSKRSSKGIVSITCSSSDGTVRAKVSASQLNSTRSNVSLIDWQDKRSPESEQKLHRNDQETQAKEGKKSSSLAQLDSRSSRRIPAGAVAVLRHDEDNNNDTCQDSSGRRKSVASIEATQEASEQKASQPAPSKPLKSIMKVTKPVEPQDKQEAKSQPDSISATSSDEEEEDKTKSAPASMIKGGPFSLLRQSFNQKTLSSMLKFSNRASLRIRPNLGLSKPAAASNEATTSMKTTSNDSKAERAQQLAQAEANLLAAKQLKQQAQKLKEQQKQQQQQQVSIDQTAMILYNQQIQRQQQHQLMYQQQQQQQQLAMAANRGLHSHRLLDANHHMQLQQQLMFQRHQQQQQQLAYHYMAAQQMAVIPQPTSAISHYPSLHTPVAPLPIGPAIVGTQQTTTTTGGGIFKKSILKSSKHQQPVLAAPPAAHQSSQQHLIPMSVNHHSSVNIVYARPPASSIPVHAAHLQEQYHQQQFEQWSQHEHEQQPQSTKQQSCLGASMRKTVKSILVNRSSFLSASNSNLAVVDSRLKGQAEQQQQQHHKQLKSTLRSSMSNLVLNSEGSDGDGSSSDSTTTNSNNEEQLIPNQLPIKSALKKTSSIGQQGSTSSVVSSSSESSIAGNNSTSNFQRSVASRCSKKSISPPRRSPDDTRASKRQPQQVIGPQTRKNVTFSTKLTSIL